MQKSPTSTHPQKRGRSMLSPQKNSRTEALASTPIASATPTSKRHRYISENMYSNRTPTSGLAESPSTSAEASTDGNESGINGKEEEEDEEPGLLNALFSPVLKYLAGGDDENKDGATEAVVVEGARDAAPAQRERSERIAQDPVVVEKESEDAHSGETERAETSDKRKDAEKKEGPPEDLFNPYAFIKSLPPHGLVVPKQRSSFVLPRKAADAPSMSLVLDLDETLVHCSVEPIGNADLTFPVVFNGVEYTVYVRKRPNFQHFMEQIAGRYEVIIFTASQQVYAEKLLNILDPENKYIDHRLYRDSCLCVEGNYLKDLTALGRDLSQTVLVDNSPHAFGYQVENGIPIDSWFDDDKDQELLKLLPFLARLREDRDVRPLIRNQFRLHELIQAS